MSGIIEQDGDVATASIRVAILVTAFGLAACGTSPPNGPGCTVTGVAVTANPSSVNTGISTSLTATITSSGCGGGVSWSATPTGGTLTPNGLTATFTAPTAGSFTVRATSTDDGTKSGTATVTVTQAAPPCGQPNGTVSTHSTNVTANETWAGDGVTHKVPASLSISGSAVLTIEPCAIVSLGPAATITVRDNARLVSAGTSSTRFVVFKRDDPNQAWGALRGFSATSLIDLTFTLLQGGGALGQTGDPTISVTGVGYGSPTAAVLRTDNVRIEGSKGVGIYLDANGGFTNDSELLSITTSGARPIHTTMMALGSVPNGPLAGNAIDEILIIGPNPNVFADMTVIKHGVPIRVPYGTMFVGPAFGATAPVTLTLEPGVELVFPRLGGGAPGARVTFGTNGSAPNNLVGVLHAMGTAADPIVFTSGEFQPAPGDWVGIWLDTATGSRLDHVVIDYAGAPNGIQSTNCRPITTEDAAALIVGDFADQYVPPSDLITNSTIRHSAGYGINAVWQAGTFNAPDLTATNTFQNNARCRQTYNGLTPPGVCPAGGGCTAP
jgi:hypothetical protein